MGKGLGLQSQGTYIAFTAGTGVLPFLDLVAYLLRLNMDPYIDREDFDQETVPDFHQTSQRTSARQRVKIDLKNFKLVLFVSFPA